MVKILNHIIGSGAKHFNTLKQSLVKNFTNLEAFII
jgi:hypothetical protein